MTIWRAALAASTGLALLAALVAAPAGAQESDFLTLDLTPSSGRAGTVITASGDDCAPAQAFNAFIQVYFADASDILDAVASEIADSGSWSVQIEVPAGTDPAGTYEVFATCFVNNGESTDVAAEYEGVPFDVTGDVVPAAPAVPVPGDPTFTG
jgi:hypothetical protein